MMEAFDNAENVDWVKQKLQVLWSSPKFCGLCLENNGNFCPVDMELMINREKFSRCLRDIVNYVFNDDVENLMSSSYLCDCCTEKIIKSFLFIHNSKQLSRLMKNCVNDIHSKVIDVDDQLNTTSPYSNAMIVLENDMDLYKSLIHTNMTEIVPIATPIPMKIYQPKVIINKKELEQPVKNIEQTAKIMNNNIEKSVSTPNISLKKGHIVIKPLNSFGNLTPRYNKYECPNCPDIFTTYRSLKEHEKAKHKKTVFRCNFCNKSYNTSQYLNIHYKTHEKVKCKLCKLILPEGELMDHLRANHANVVYPCKFCNLVYYSQNSLVTHFNSNHLINDTKMKIQCVMCLKNSKDDCIKTHKCKFLCPECFVMPCIHYKYLKSYREQTLNLVNKVKCIDCDYVTERKELLISHVNREHLDHHPFTCDHCGQQFYTKLSLKTHIMQFHQDLNCEYCDFKFKDKNTLENHKKKCKIITRPFACNHCLASFHLEEDLIYHENLTHSSSVHACNLCNSKFLSNIKLEEHHVAVHGGIQSKKRRKHIECTLCDMMFRSIKEMVQHEKTHSPNEMFPCKVCSKQFNSLTKLYTHNQKHIDKVRCTHCSKLVAASFYPQHAVRCKVKVPSKHVCGTCGKGFYLKSLLQLHQKVHEKRVRCSHCDRNIKSTSLQRHIELIHRHNIKSVKQPSISCEVCGHLVRKKSDLEAHMNRYHLKIKPYVCHICNKDFCGKVRLKEHITTHTNDNSCFCSVCNKKFANRVCLKMHFRMHTGELPYECDICGQKFRTSSMMKTHRLKKHWEKTVSCPLCDSMFYMAREMRHHFKKVHWKYKDRPFDVRQVEELSEKYYHLFEDGRLPKLGT